MSTVEIQVLPAVPIPKKLTARHAAETLGEHFTAFLAANNLHGYLENPDYVLRDDRVNDVLLKVVISDGLRDTELKKLAFTIKNLTEKQIGVTKAYELMARALGYKGWQLARLCKEENGFIPNVWKGERSAVQNLFIEEVLKAHEFETTNRNPMIAELFARNGFRNLKADRDEKLKKVMKKDRQAKRANKA